MADEMTSLDAMLNPPADDAPPQTEPVITAPESPPPAAPAQEARPRGPDGKFLPAEPAAPAAPAAPEPAAAPAPQTPEPPKEQQFTERERAFLKAAQEERDKRQALERKLAETKPPVEVKDFWTDPDARIKAMEDHMQQVQITTVLQTTEAIARSQHPDFQEKLDSFGKLMEQTPGLYQQWLASPNPAEFAYKTAKNHMDLQQAGNLDTLKANIEKELRIKIEAEMEAKRQELEAARAAIPPTLSDARSVGNNNAPVWGGPTPLDNILKP
jgi:hypothetical protein